MREIGFYWVRMDGHKWEVALWIGRVWTLSGTDASFTDADFAEIDEGRLTRPSP